MKKRVLSLFMALALCLTLLPAPAWAAEADAPEGGTIVQEEQQEKAPAAESPAILEQAAENGIAAQNGGDNPVENAVAEVTVNGTTMPYTDIDAAFAAAQEADSATVKLLADVTISHDDYSGIALKKGNITLDLNGKTLSKSKRDDNWFYAKNAVFWLLPPEATTKDEFLAALRMPVRLTVQDSSADGNGKIVQPNGGPAVTATLNTILTVNGGTIENASSVDLDDDSHMKPNCAVLLSGGSKAVINGGTLSGMRGVAVTGYITKETEGLYKDNFGIDGYNNDTYGNELTVTGGNICATSGEALIVYEKAKKIELSGGTFTTQSNAYSIWVADTEAEGEPTIKGDASSLLASGYRYEYNDTECAYSEDGKGVTGNATVALRPANEYAYIGKDGTAQTQANCTEITESTDDISTPGWYVVKENLTISSLNISGEVNLILYDGATLTVTSLMNVAAGSTLNLFWQSAGSGKLTAAAISVLGTVTAPAGEMKRTTGEGGTTFEKCFEHDWGYTNNGDTHTAMCKLCGKAEAAESHKYDSWAPTDANTHTGTCACGATKTEGHTLTCTPNADGLTHSTKCSVCGYTAAAESHDFNQTDNYGKKCACGAYLAAECNGQQYATLARAIEAANGADIKLLTIVSENVVVDGDSIKAGVILGNGKTIDDIPYPSNWVADRSGIPLTMEAGEITLKDGALAQFTGYASANNAIALKGGTLTVADTVTKIIGSVASESGQRAAIEATGGVLDLQGNTLLDGGLTMSGDAQLKNKLTAGTFTNSGSETYSVSVEGSSQYTTVFDLLETGYAFAVYNKDAPTGDVIAKDTTTRELTEDVAVIKCTHKGANNKSLFKDNTCTGCGFTCAHETVENGVCTVCKQQMKAKASASDGTEQYYLDLQEAFEGVADGGTVTMLTTLTDDDTISFCCDAEGNPVEKTVTLMMNGHSLSYEGASSLNIQSGKLIIGDEATISQPATAAMPAVFIDNDEQSKDRGTLEFKGKANLTGGLFIQNWGKLEGGLKEGTIITSNGTYSVSVERSETYSNVLGLLGDGLAFAKKDHPDELVNGNVKQLTEDVIVVAHKHSPKYTEIDDPNDPEHTYRYICECGFVCPHNSFTHSICDTCHTACTHDVCDSEGRCLLCDAQSAVLVKYIDNIGLTSTKPYMKTTDQDGNDVTLQQVFDEAKDGSTVTLLVDGLRASGEVTGKTITLDLNGKSLIETSNGIRVDPNSTLKVTGSGSIAANISVGAKGTLDLSGWRGGTINTVGLSNNGTDESTLTVGENAGTIRDLEILNWPSELIAKTKLRGGSYNKILITMKSGTGADKTIPYSSMLAEGYAFQYVDPKEFVDYAAAAQYSNGDGSISNVKVVKCPHDKINEDGYCAYCNATGFVAQVTAADGSSSAYTDIAAAIAAAGGGTVKLLANAREITINSPLKLDLNGKTAAKLTVTGDVTLASLLPEGYTFKSGSAWISDLSGTELTNVSMAKIPIKSMNYPTEMSMTYGDAGTLLVNVAKETDTGDVNFQWYKVEDGKETAVGSATTSNRFDLSAQNLSAGQHTFRFSATCDGYEKMSKDIVVTVQRANISASLITSPAARENLTYTGQEQALITAGIVTSGGTMQYSLTENGTYSQDIPTGTDAGAYTVWYRVIGDANHNDTAPASVAVSIGKKPLTITGVTAASKPYDGTTNADISSVTFDNVTLNRGTDYTVTANFDDASVGNGKNVTATVTLMGQAAKNYALEQSSFPTTGSIIKAAAPDFTKETALTIVNGHEKTYTVTLPALPTLETPKEYGALTYEIGEIKLNDGYYTSGAKVENGELTLPIQKNDVETTGSVGTVTVVIKSANYEDITLTVNVNATNKLVPIVTAPTANALTYNGTEQALVTAGQTTGGTMLYRLGDSEWSEHIPTAKNAGKYTVWYKVQGDAEYADVAEQSLTVSAAKKSVTVTALDKSAYTGSTAPDLSSPKADKNYKVEGLVGADTLSGTVTLTYAQTPDMSKPGKTAINIAGTLSNDNYEITYVPGTLTVSDRPSSGGGGSSSDRDTSSSGTVKTETTKNNDGSVTKTETKKDGTKVETTTGKDGSVSKTTTNPNGSSVTETKATDGSTGTVKTDKHGQTTAETALSSKAIETAKRNGEPVKAPVEVKASRDSSTAPTVKVELPKNSGDTKVEIPVSNVKPGTVAVLVHADGTEEIVKNSLPTEDGIQLTVNGSETVKIVDNSKDFIDTRNHWAKDAIDFVSARGLVNGMSATIYAPNASTTRAQLWTILARQNNADLTGGATWFENAQNWAKEKGISDGTNPNGTINRAQMVTMLWRAMGQPAAGSAASFTDVPTDSYYAQAVAWAVENGITAGVGGGRFDPNATCTRAQIVTFLYRSYQSK